MKNKKNHSLPKNKYLKKNWTKKLNFLHDIFISAILGLKDALDQHRLNELCLLNRKVTAFEQLF